MVISPRSITLCMEIITGVNATTAPYGLEVHFNHLANVNIQHNSSPSGKTDLHLHCCLGSAVDIKDADT